MRRIVALLIALGMIVVFSGAALAGDGSGSCQYSSHLTQANAEKADAAKTAATKTPLKEQAEKLILAQKDKLSKPVSEKK